MEEDRVGLRVEPELNSEYLRGGTRPELREFASEQEEFAFIHSEIEWLLQQGFDARKIAVLHRRKRGVRRLGCALHGADIEPATIQALIGLGLRLYSWPNCRKPFRWARSARHTPCQKNGAWSIWP